MISKKKLLGATLVTAAALAFSTAPITSAFANTHHTGEVKCFGLNSCKGKGGCKSNLNSCKGKNSCEHKGVEMKKSKQECVKEGGTTTAPKK